MTTNGQNPKYLLRNGELIAYKDAQIHALSTSLKYGVGVFEGFRAYWCDERHELFAFRVDDHMQRLLDSMRVVEIDGPQDAAVLKNQLLGLIRANNLKQNLHLRTQVFVTSPDGKPDDTGPVTVIMAAIPMGNYFGKSGLNVQVSSWSRISERNMPPRVKSIANYQNGRLAMLEARRNGYDAALIPTEKGQISEGAGYNFFMVRDGVLYTPPVTESILEGITRDSLIHLAKVELGLDVQERPIDRTELYSADELFVCGSAAEVTHLISVDGKRITGNTPGPITRELNNLYKMAVIDKVASDQRWTSGVYSQIQRVEGS